MTGLENGRSPTSRAEADSTRTGTLKRMWDIANQSASDLAMFYRKWFADHPSELTRMQQFEQSSPPPAQITNKPSRKKKTPANQPPLL